MKIKDCGINRNRITKAENLTKTYKHVNDKEYEKYYIRKKRNFIAKIIHHIYSAKTLQITEKK